MGFLCSSECCSRGGQRGGKCGNQTHWRGCLFVIKFTILLHAVQRAMGQSSDVVRFLQICTQILSPTGTLPHNHGAALYSWAPSQGVGLSDYIMYPAHGGQHSSGYPARHLSHDAQGVQTVDSLITKNPPSQLLERTPRCLSTPRCRCMFQVKERKTRDPGERNCPAVLVAARGFGTVQMKTLICT